MRIVYNLRDQDWQTTKSLGILHVSTRILAGLAKDPEIERIDVLANGSLSSALAPLGNSERVRFHFANAPAPRRWSRLLWDHWSMTRVTNRLSPDWLLLPKGFAPLVARPRCRVSAYVHDTIFHYYRDAAAQPFPRGQSFLFTLMLRRTAESAAVVATNSAFTAAEFRAGFSPRGHVVRIGAPVEPACLATASAVSAPASSLLLPTSAWPHKLTGQAIAWLRRWTTEERFTGTIHGFGSLAAGVCWPQVENWHHHGRIPQPALERLQASDSLLIFFSAYEGYGLPPVEALASNRRTIASDLPPLRETLPGEILFSNDDYDAFKHVLNRALARPAPKPLLLDTATSSASRWVAALKAKL